MKEMFQDLRGNNIVVNLWSNQILEISLSQKWKKLTPRFKSPKSTLHNIWKLLFIFFKFYLWNLYCNLLFSFY